MVDYNSSSDYSREVLADGTVIYRKKRQVSEQGKKVYAKVAAENKAKEDSSIKIGRYETVNGKKQFVEKDLYKIEENDPSTGKVVNTTYLSQSVMEKAAKETKKPINQVAVSDVGRVGERIVERQAAREEQAISKAQESFVALQPDLAKQIGQVDPGYVKYAYQPTPQQLARSKQEEDWRIPYEKPVNQPRPAQESTIFAGKPTQPPKVESASNQSIVPITQSQRAIYEATKDAPPITPNQIKKDQHKLVKDFYNSPYKIGQVIEKGFSATSQFLLEGGTYAIDFAASGLNLVTVPVRAAYDSTVHGTPIKESFAEQWDYFKEDIKYSFKTPYSERTSISKIGGQILSVPPRSIVGIIEVAPASAYLSYSAGTGNFEKMPSFSKDISQDIKQTFTTKEGLIDLGLMVGFGVASIGGRGRTATIKEGRPIEGEVTRINPPPAYVKQLTIRQSIEPKFSEIVIDVAKDVKGRVDYFIRPETQYYKEVKPVYEKPVYEYGGEKSVVVDKFRSNDPADVFARSEAAELSPSKFFEKKASGAYPDNTVSDAIFNEMKRSGKIVKNQKPQKPEVFTYISEQKNAVDHEVFRFETNNPERIPFNIFQVKEFKDLLPGQRLQRLKERKLIDFDIKDNLKENIGNYFKSDDTLLGRNIKMSKERTPIVFDIKDNLKENIGNYFNSEDTLWGMNYIQKLKERTPNPTLESYFKKENTLLGRNIRKSIGNFFKSESGSFNAGKFSTMFDQAKPEIELSKGKSYKSEIDAEDPYIEVKQSRDIDYFKTKESESLSSFEKDITRPRGRSKSRSKISEGLVGSGVAAAIKSENAIQNIVQNNVRISEPISISTRSDIGIIQKPATRIKTNIDERIKIDTKSATRKTEKGVYSIPSIIIGGSILIGSEAIYPKKKRGNSESIIDERTKMPFGGGRPGGWSFDSFGMSDNASGRRTMYTPSLAAIGLGISGKEPKGTDYGLSFRPIVRRKK